MLLEFTVYGVPRPQGSKRIVTNRRTGRAIPIEASKFLKKYREDIAVTAREEIKKQYGSGHLPPIGDREAVSVGIGFYFERPKGTTRRSPTVRPDIDKLTRSVLDALTGILYADDAQVTHLYVRKRYFSQDARTLIRVRLDC